MTAPARASRDMFDLLEAKEAELVALRRKASIEVLEELRLRDERLSELRQDFEHNLQLLRQRDQVVANLERSAAESTERQRRDLSQAAERTEEQIATIKQDYDRRLHSEVDRRLAEREHSLREELAASAASQLAEREREIKAAYERASADREATCKRREATADKRVQDVERSGAIDLKEAEDRFMALEVELRDKVARAEQAKGQAESRLRETVAESDGATTQRQEQLERLISEVKSLRSDNVRLDRLNTDKDGKISDLLQTLVDLEAGFVREHEALGKERDALALELDSQCVELEELQRVSGSYEKALTKMEKKMEKRKRHWAEKEMALADTVDGLQKQLQTLQASQAEGDEVAQQKLKSADKTIVDLEGRLLQLQEESSRFKSELKISQQEVEAEQQRLDSLRRDHRQALDQAERSKSVALQEIQSKHEAEMDRSQQEAIDDVRRALIDKNATSDELRAKIASLETQLAECKGRPTKDDVERLEGDNSRLSDAISSLQAQISKHSSSSVREEELSQQVQDLSEELKVVTDDRRRLIELSNRLKAQADQQRSQSAERPRESTANEEVLSTQPLSLAPSHNSKMAAQGGTDSQRQVLDRLRKKKELQQQQGRTRVRNWNNRGDG